MCIYFYICTIFFNSIICSRYLVGSQVRTLGGVATERASSLPLVISGGTHPLCHTVGAEDRRIVDEGGVLTRKMGQGRSPWGSDLKEEQTLFMWGARGTEGCCVCKPGGELTSGDTYFLERFTCLETQGITRELAKCFLCMRAQRIAGIFKFLIFENMWQKQHSQLILTLSLKHDLFSSFVYFAKSIHTSYWRFLFKNTDLLKRDIFLT